MSSEHGSSGMEFGTNGEGLMGSLVSVIFACAEFAPQTCINALARSGGVGEVDYHMTRAEKHGGGKGGH